MVKVSVIVPVYNVEQYLSQCLESICRQTLKDIEIICVNDGSTDDSREIIREYQGKDSRIKCIEKKNSGYGDSMNKGFLAAEGEYVGIVESDDFVDPDMFEKLYITAKRNKADVVKSNFWLYWTDSGKNELYHYFSPDECNQVIEPLSYGKGSLFSRKPSIWSAIYRKDFINENKIRFLATPGASFQDTSFTFKVFSCAKRMVCLKEAFLHYRQDNAASSVNNVDKKMYFVCDEYEEIERFIKGNPDKAEQLYPVYGAAFYDACIWMYEELSYTKRYEFLLHVSACLKRLISEIGSDNFEFGGCWWKWRDLKRIAENPFEYHIWRNVERYEQKGASFQYKTPCTPVGNFDAVKKSQAALNKKPVFSIIVPIYNCEKFLRSCLESLWLQTFQDFEVICINDGSVDHSLSVIEEYASVDNRFVVVNQKNSGPSVSRNMGLELAQGEYVLFLDSDDYYSQDACKRLHKEVNSGRKQDAVIFGTELFPDMPRASEWHYRVLTTPDRYFGKIDQKELLTVPYLKVYSWRCCFRRSFLDDNKIRFLQDFQYGEDALFLFDALPKCNGVSVISDKLYHYRHCNGSSLMNVIFRNPIEYADQQMKVLDQLLVVGSSNHILPSKELMEYCCDYVYTAISNCPIPEKYRIVKFFVRIIESAHLETFLDEVSDNCRNFYLYCLEEQKNDRISRKIKRRTRDFLLRIFPPSRKAFYEYSSAIMRQIDVQQQSINNLQQQLQRVMDIEQEQKKIIDSLSIQLQKSSNHIKEDNMSVQKEKTVV